MPTKEQLYFFKALYEAEEERINILTKRAELYFSIISIFFTAVLFNIKDVSTLIKKDPILIVLFVSALIILGIALGLILYSIKLREYEGLTDIKEYENNPPITNEDFFVDRIADYTVAFQRNSETNNNRAGWLMKASYFILAGLLIVIIFIIVLVAK